jgi:hypothetical protein
MTPSTLEHTRGMQVRVEEFHDVVSEMVAVGYTVERITFPDGGVTAQMISPDGYDLEVSRWVA